MACPCSVLVLRAPSLTLLTCAAACKKRGKVGTVMYQAPELLRKLPHGPEVDWWAFGCLILEMTGGRSPFLRDDEDLTEAAVLAHSEGSLPTVERASKEDADGASTEAATTSASAAHLELLRELCIDLLHPSPAERLGSRARGGVAGLQAHGWFEGLDWAACLAMSGAAPSVPPSLDVEDTDATLLELSRCCQQGFDF